MKYNFLSGRPYLVPVGQLCNLWLFKPWLQRAGFRRQMNLNALNNQSFVSLILTWTTKGEVVVLGSYEVPAVAKISVYDSYLYVLTSFSSPYQYVDWGILLLYSGKTYHFHLYESGHLLLPSINVNVHSPFKVQCNLDMWYYHGWKRTIDCEASFLLKMWQTMSLSEPGKSCLKRRSRINQMLPLY